MDAISVRKFPREHHHSHQERHTAKVVLARGSEYISEQMLVADLHHRLKDLDVHGIYQTGRSYIWYLEFEKEEHMREFIEIPIMVKEKYTASISAMCEQRTTVKVFWLPTYVRESFVRSFFAPYGKVLTVIRERVMLEKDKYCYGGTYTVEMVLSDRQKEEIPHLVKYDLGISMLITMAGRPPLCLKCNNIGHIRKNCPENAPRNQATSGSYADAARRDPAQREEARLPPPPPQPPSAPPDLPAEPDIVPIEYSARTSKPPKSGRSVPPDPAPSIEDQIHKGNEEAEAEAEAEAELEANLSDGEEGSTSTLGGITALPQSPVEPSSPIYDGTSPEDMEASETTARTTGLKRKTDHESVVRNIATKYADDDVS